MSARLETQERSDTYTIDEPLLDGSYPLFDSGIELNLGEVDWREMQLHDDPKEIGDKLLSPDSPLIIDIGEYRPTSPSPSSSPLVLWFG